MSKRDLQKLISTLREKKFAEGQGKQIAESTRKELAAQFGPAIQDVLKQYGESSNQVISEALSKIQIPQAQIPEYPQPIVNVPEAPVPIFRPNITVPAPIVNVPAPIVNIPPAEPFPSRMSVGLDEISSKSPLPVMLFDIKGNPITSLGGGSTGKADFFTIKDIRASTVSIIDQDTGALKVVGNFSASSAGATTVSLVNVDGTYYNSDNPLPVTFSAASVQPVSQVSGNAWSVSVTDVFQTIGTNVVNPDGRIKVELPTGSSGLTDTELRATAVPVSQVSGILWSTNVVDAFGSTAVGSVFNADNRIRVSVETGGSGLTDAELRATQLQVQQVSGYTDSVYVTGVAASVYAEIMNPDGRVKVELPTGSSGLTDTELRASHLDVDQVSGSSWSTFVTGFGASISATILNGEGLARDSWVVSDVTASIKASLIDSSGVQYSGSNPVPITWVSGAGVSTTVNIGDSSGVGYSGSNPVPVTLAVSNATATVNATLVDSTGAYRGTLPVAVVAGSAAIGSVTVNGSLNSILAVGTIVSDAADVGDAPIKIGGIARTANPTAVAAGDRVSATFDDLGRQVIRNVQVRDLIQTAYVSVTNGTETTLRAAVAGSYLDLIMIVASNNSDAAVSVDIRSVTAGNIINTLRVPANGTAGWTPPVPWPQDATGNNWTVDGPDETGRTMTFSALFSQEL